GPSAHARQGAARNRIEPAKARGSWFTAFSWRLAVLVGVVVLAAAVVLPSLRSYFRQQEELAALRADAVAAQQEVDDLSAEAARWDDPAFVVAQARERLAYVFPGETPYRVIDPETVEGAVDGSPAAVAETESDESGTWYTRLWDSLETAGAAD
uniref:FtsB family cell division protein n=1 Tax=Demequina sp. TaxID=2050685 RepID=UPI0025CD30DD